MPDDQNDDDQYDDVLDEEPVKSELRIVGLGPSWNGRRFVCCGNGCGGPGDRCPYPQTRPSWRPDDAR